LTSALEGGEWSASRPGRFTPRERSPVTHWIGGWVGPKAIMDEVVKRNIPSPRRESNPRTQIVQTIIIIIIIIITTTTITLDKNWVKRRRRRRKNV
jgi:hypothetical protein